MRFFVVRHWSGVTDWAVLVCWIWREISLCSFGGQLCEDSDDDVETIFFRVSPNHTNPTSDIRCCFPFAKVFIILIKAIA